MNPEWTELGHWSSGIDPLGLQGYPVSLYQSLAPGISNITMRPRYYALYPWLCSVNAKTEALRFTRHKDWRRFIRRAETLLALSAFLTGRNDEGGVAGIDWARNVVWDGKSIDIRPAADPENYDDENARYLKAREGAFGAAYRAIFTKLGILAYAQEHEIPVPTPDTGDTLAEAFNSIVGSRGEAFVTCVREGRATAKQLREFGEALHPASIVVGSKEWELICDIIFGRKTFTNGEDEARRKTFLLLLAISRQIRREPTVDDVRWITYTGHLQDDRPFECPEYLRGQVRRWKTYQTSDLVQISVGALLKALVEIIPDEGVPVSEAADSLGAKISDAMKDCVTWEALGLKIDQAEAKGARPSKMIEVKLTEDVLSALHERQRQSSLGGAIAAINLLAILDQRFSSVDWRATTALDELHSDYRSPQDVLSFVRNIKDQPLEDVISQIVRRFVIEGHLSEAYRKLYGQTTFTFLFQFEEGRLSNAVENIRLGYTSPRLDRAIVFLKDLKLIGASGITPEGLDILEGTR